jgi:hypothetical protein
MKLVIYNLNTDGTIPEYITDGGYFALVNSNPSPQDLDLVGVATDAAPQSGFVSKDELLTYVQTNNFIFKDPITEENLPIELIISLIWNKQFEIATTTSA